MRRTASVTPAAAAVSSAASRSRAWPRARSAPLVCALLVALSAAVSGCASAPTPPAAAPGLADLMARPAEGALFDGIRAYDDGRYEAAEAHLRRALDAGLASARDRATAHKLLAFVTCTSSRVPECEAQFRAARAADPSFALERAEAGHPVWGPAYRRVAAP